MDIFITSHEVRIQLEPRKFETPNLRSLQPRSNLRVARLFVRKRKQEASSVVREEYGDHKSFLGALTA